MNKNEIITRVILYTGIAVLPVLIAGLKAAVAWPVLVLECLLAGFIAVRAFLDESVSDYKQKQ